ncbi:MAG: cupredoxin domain-containing protein [Actinomycetota bacterium]
MPSSKVLKLLLALALVAGSLALAAPPARAIPTKTVTAASSSWQPKKVRLVRRNGKGIIKWTNTTGILHNVRSSNRGTNWTMGTKALPIFTGLVKRIFKKRGTYYFRCMIHENLGMIGKVIVR